MKNIKFMIVNILDAGKGEERIRKLWRIRGFTFIRKILFLKWVMGIQVFIILFSIIFYVSEIFIKNGINIVQCQNEHL